jgi:hypothetical protein
MLSVMETKENDVRAAFREQAIWGEKLGSPFTALLCNTLADWLNSDNPVGQAILSWPGDPSPKADVLGLRLAGVLHALAKRDVCPELSNLYPPNPLPSECELQLGLEAVFASAPDEILSWLNWAPQTNEVARSIPLNAGLMYLARQISMPLDLLEVGASGGLNLQPDRYGYDYQGSEAGDRTSPLELTNEWSGGPPPIASYEVASRRGVDLNPLDLTSPLDQERLRSYVWPDQKERLDRVSSAIDIAQSAPPVLDKQDAADWVEKNITTSRASGTCQVLMHSIAFQYFPAKSQNRIKRHLSTVGETATKDKPLAWLRYEVDPELDNKASLRLTLWPQGTEKLLAVGDPHCRSIEWLENS